MVFNSPKAADAKKILNPVFGVSKYTDLGKGLNKANYARFCREKTIFDFINYLTLDYDETDVILMGDFNLEKKNPFWDRVLKAWRVQRFL